MDQKIPNCILNIKMEEIIYWQIPKFYSKPECKKIIKLGLSQESSEAKVGEVDETGINKNRLAIRTIKAKKNTTKIFLLEAPIYFFLFVK